MNKRVSCGISYQVLLLRHVEAWSTAFGNCYFWGTELIFDSSFPQL